MILETSVDRSTGYLTDDFNKLFHDLPFHPFGESLRGWIARFLRRMAALQLLGMERHSASLRLALHPKNRTLHPVQLRFLG